MEAIVPLLFVLLIIFAVAMMGWNYFRAEDILRRWARNNGFKLLSAERRWFRRGPFFFWTSKSQVVFYVTVRTSDDRIRHGWVRCGSWFLGVLIDQAEARWDK